MSPKTIILKRVYADMYRTFGVLIDRDGPFAVTLEDPWEKNKRDISCIPAGMYWCQRVNSPKFGNTYEIKGVRDRTHILFHKGNTEEDTRGCVLVGEEYGILNANAAILASGRGFNDLITRLHDADRFVLIIINCS